jgi:hypothetical protein
MDDTTRTRDSKLVGFVVAAISFDAFVKYANSELEPDRVPDSDPEPDWADNNPKLRLNMLYSGNDIDNWDSNFSLHDFYINQWHPCLIREMNPSRIVRESSDRRHTW